MRARLGTAGLALVLALPWVACRKTAQGDAPSGRIMPNRDIHAVLRDHDRELMAIPGVAGVYVGLMRDGKTQCLKVMLVKKTPEAVRRIPKSLEGYAVVPEESGVIRPMPGK